MSEPFEDCSVCTICGEPTDEHGEFVQIGLALVNLCSEHLEEWNERNVDCASENGEG